MTEKELIEKIKELKNIEPEKNWVFLTKTKILSEKEPKANWLFSFLSVFKLKELRPVYFSLSVIFILVSLALIQNAVPGDFLYPVKKIAEKSQTIFIPEQEKTKAQLEILNKRLEEITRIAQNNDTRKLAPALKEYKETANEVVKKLSKSTATSSNPKIIKELVQETRKLEKSKEILEKSYGIAGLESEEEANPTKLMAELLIKDLEKRSLNEQQLEILKEAKELYEKGDFNEALTKLLNLSYPQD